MMDPPFETDPEGPPAKALRYALAKAGLDAEAKGVPYGTDATKIAAGGTPCVIFGPGDIAQAHKSDEWIDLPQVALATEVVIEAVKRLDRILKEEIEQSMPQESGRHRGASQIICMQKALPVLDKGQRS